jgi:hypothetical protein
MDYTTVVRDGEVICRVDKDVHNVSSMAILIALMSMRDF